MPTKNIFIVISFLLIVAGTIPCEVRAYSGEDFLTQLRGKFKTTSNIYLEAKSTRLTNGNGSNDSVASETASVTIAYQYPNRFIQKMVGTSNSRQYVIIKEDTMVISYPHLDFYRERSVNDRQIQRLLVNHIPMAAALMGVTQGDVEGDSITAELRDGMAEITVRGKKGRFPFHRINGRFERDGLIPRELMLQGEKVFKLEVEKYVEEKRFPIWVEKAFATMDVSWMEDKS